MKFVGRTLLLAELCASLYFSADALRAAPAPTLTSLSISGPNVVPPNAAIRLTATALFSDGSAEAVTPLWSVDSASAIISSDGFLHALAVTTNTQVNVTASYTTNSVTRTASTNVTIQIPQPPTLAATIAGNQVVITWPTNDPSFNLFYATNLPPTVWISNAARPPVVSGQYTVTNGINDQMRLYRLKSYPTGRGS
jgi:hypothetical protein